MYIHNIRICNTNTYACTYLTTTINELMLKRKLKGGDFNTVSVSDFAVLAPKTYPEKDVSQPHLLNRNLFQLG